MPVAVTALSPSSAAGTTPRHCRVAHGRQACFAGRDTSRRMERGSIMNETGESQRHVQQMREEAVATQTKAERTGDPEERGRLEQKARQLEFDSEQESMMAAGDIYPAE
jgi:hypothetical protein